MSVGSLEGPVLLWVWGCTVLDNVNLDAASGSSQCEKVPQFSNQCSCALEKSFSAHPAWPGNRPGLPHPAYDDLYRGGPALNRRRDFFYI